MSAREKRILSDLFTLARDLRSDPLAHRAHLAACLVHRNRIIAYGMNQLKTHPFQAQFGKNPDSIYWHSETQCIHNALRKFDSSVISTSTLYVARSKRVKGKDILGLAKPCRGCMNAVMHYKIPRVVYTNNQDEDGFSYSTLELN